ncbi:hypothetical protein ACFW3D_28090 [Streptomyces sp. NPDC058864]
MRTRLAVVAAALAAAAVLTGCSGSNDTAGSSAPAAGSDDRSAAAAAALEESVRTYTKALFGNDATTAYKLVSTRCKKEMTAGDYVTMAETAHHDYGALTIKNVKVDQIGGDLARVSYGVGVPQFERTAQPWVREGGTWRWDACKSSA